MKIEIKKYDNLGAFGGFAQGSVKEGQTIILIDTNMIFKDGELIYDDGKPLVLNTEEKKRVLIETIMHEFGHALEEFFDTKFEEDFIERVTMSYNK